MKTEQYALTTTEKALLVRPYSMIGRRWPEKSNPAILALFLLPFLAAVLLQPGSLWILAGLGCIAMLGVVVMYLAKNRPESIGPMIVLALVLVSLGVAVL